MPCIRISGKIAKVFTNREKALKYGKSLHKKHQFGKVYRKGKVILITKGKR